MSNYIAHTESRRGYTLKIIADSGYDNPFLEYDCNPDIITFLRGYDFTTQKECQTYDAESFLAEAKRRGYFVRALYAYIHSGIAFSLSRNGQFSDRFDLGFAVFIFWTPEKRESLGLTDSYVDSVLQESETRESWLETSLAQAVRLLNDYAQGNVWGYVIENPHNEHIESCWGFYGGYDSDGGPLESGRESLEALANTEFEKTKIELVTLAQEYAALVKATSRDSDKLAPEILSVLMEKIKRMKEESERLETRIEELQEDSKK
jgi:hypothetical protein